MIIKDATIDDINDIIPCLEEYINHLNTISSFHTNWDEAHARDMLHRSIQSDESVYIMAQDGKNIVGGLWLVVFDSFHDPLVRVSVEHMWHCSQSLSSRKKIMVLDNLLAYGEQWSKDHNANKIMASVNTESPLVKYLNKKKYHQHEIVLSKSLGG